LFRSISPGGRCLSSLKLKARRLRTEKRCRKNRNDEEENCFHKQGLCASLSSQRSIVATKNALTGNGFAA
jgi:hypothetical protein